MELVAKLDIPEYDLICFSVIYLTGVAAKMPYLEGPTRELNKLFHFAHYDAICQALSQEPLSGSESKQNPSDTITAGPLSDSEKSLQQKQDSEQTKI